MKKEEGGEPWIEQGERKDTFKNIPKIIKINFSLLISIFMSFDTALC